MEESAKHVLRLQNMFYTAKHVLQTVLQVMSAKHVLQPQNMFCIRKTCFTVVKQVLLFIVQLTCHMPCELSIQEMFCVITGPRLAKHFLIENKHLLCINAYDG